VTDINEEVQAPKKRGPKPKRPPERPEIGASRVSYKDRHKLTVANRDDANYVYRIVNSDKDRYKDRIATMLARGYTICKDGEQIGDPNGTDASSIGSSATKSVGNGVKGVLMKIPRKFYEEDKAAKQAEVDRTEEGMVDEELRNSDDVYGEGLKISDSKGTRLEVRRRS
jgi:hypothetical protein